MFKVETVSAGGVSGVIGTGGVVNAPMGWTRAGMKVRLCALDVLVGDAEALADEIALVLE